jgi:hypothetical protein
MVTDGSHRLGSKVSILLTIRPSSAWHSIEGTARHSYIRGNIRAVRGLSRLVIL